MSRISGPLEMRGKRRSDEKEFAGIALMTEERADMEEWRTMKQRRHSYRTPP